MSDVLNDANTMREQYIASLTERHDPADLLSVFGLLLDAFYEGSQDRIQEMMDFELAQNLIQFTQSNPNGVQDDIVQALNASMTEI